jgi:hypothetical protein
MTDSWQPEPSPWLSPTPRNSEQGGQTGHSGQTGQPGQSSHSALIPVAQPNLHGAARPSPEIHSADPMATQMVAVGTVQPREPRLAGGSVEEAERILGQAVDVLGVDPSGYAIGGATEGAVCLVPEDGRWSVFLAEDGARRFAGSFDDPEQAAVHFAGVLLLAGAERGTLPKAFGGANGAGGADSGYDAMRSSDPLAAFLAGPPIEPLAGDPPSSLYTDRRLMVLTPGTEVDRFGDQEGNTVYAARTRYPHRSLPPDFIDRDYRVYRLRDPLRAVVGTAIPWFGQPGGGIAYVLPRPIRELIREGVLVEIPAATVAQP